MAKADVKTKPQVKVEGVSSTPYAEALIAYVSAFCTLGLGETKGTKKLTQATRRAWAIDYLNRHAAFGWQTRTDKEYQ
ncbi:hypothetical protein [uncultured Shewanella sp.]|uniref:hypothetical protein n=1 Tax=uncultured Shewanella sp. TaxID=173975 RepID=UPI0026205EC8|nr:hypothetical protein [uncultured Shewanella sp.]